MCKFGLTLVVTAILLAGARPAAGDEVAERFVHKTGFSIALPDGWDRDERQEKGGVIFAAMFDRAPKKYVLFRVEHGPSDGFDGAAWLEREKATMAKAFGSADGFAKESVKVGGIDTAAYTASGKITRKDGSTYELRTRVRGIVSGVNFFRVQEASYNGAHTGFDAQLDEVWDAISFQEGDGDAEAGGGPPDIAPAPESTGGAMEDKAGNFKLKYPKGWEMASPPPDDEKSIQRGGIRRVDAQGNVLVHIQFFVFESTRPETFTIDTPGDYLEKTVDRGYGLLEGTFGERSRGTVRPVIDQAKGLGGAEKSSAYEYRGLSIKEIEKKREIETLIRRGDKKAKMPDYKDRVVRGRISLLSPKIYLAQAYFNRHVADNPALVKEFNDILDGFEFIESGAKPPALNLGAGPVPNTVDDPANAKERKEAFVHIDSSPRKQYKLAFKFTVPPGFMREPKVKGPAITLIASDKDNNWVRIFVAASSAARLADEKAKFGPKAQVLSGWKSNWTSKARGASMKEKGSKVSLGGQANGPGFKYIEGTVEGFKGTFSGVLIDKSGWRVTIEMETRGDHTIYEKRIKSFFKSLKWKKTK